MTDISTFSLPAQIMAHKRHTMRFGSVCSGIEAASVAWHPLGWEAAWLSEIEPFPSAVLKHHYPDVPNLGDMTTLPDRIRAGEVEAPDLFCGGTPCQAFSVAGLRKSLDDARGNLSLTFCEIANAIDDIRLSRGELPAVIFWENVPGVLSTKDNAFGCFLAGLAGDDEPVVHPQGKWKNSGVVVGPERLAVWRVLDAQYFGVAQRRRRVFVLSVSLRHPRAWAIAESLLPLSEGVRGDTAPSRETRQSVAPTIAGCANGGGANGPGRDVDSVESLQVVNRGTWWDGGDVAATMTTKSDDQRMPDKDNAQLVMVPVAHVETMPTMLNGANTAAGHNARSGHTKDQYIVPVAFHPTQDPISSEDMCHSIGANDNATAAVMQPINIYGGNKRADRPEGGFYVRMDEDTSKTLDAATGLNPTCSQGGTAVLAPTLTASNDPSRSPQSSEVTAQVAAVFEAANSIGWSEELTASVELAGTLQRGGDGGRHDGVMTSTMQVRRLTPVECERLQGFPDNYTAIPWRGKPADQCPDGPRYKALGNSWAVPVVRWIGSRIDAAVNDLPTAFRKTFDDGQVTSTAPATPSKPPQPAGA